MLPLETIQKDLISIVAKSLEIPEITVHLTSSLINDLEAESIDIMDIRFAIEQKFGFKFNLEEIRALGTAQKIQEKDIPALFTVGSLFDYIVYKLTPKDVEKQG